MADKSIIDLELNKKELDELVEFLDGDKFRSYGYGHVTLRNGDVLLITCNDLVKNREDYENSLIESGLRPEEIVEHLKKVDEKKD